MIDLPNKSSNEPIITIEMLLSFLKNAKPECPTCRIPFRIEDMDSWDNPAGYYLEGYEEKQWIFFHCQKCTCDQSLNRLLREWVVKKDLIKQGIIVL